MSALKKLIITFILLSISFSLFYATDIISIQEGNWILTVNTGAIKVVLIFTVLIFFIILVIKLFTLKNHEIKNQYEFKFQNTPIDQLFKRYTRKEISFEKFVKLQKEIRKVNSDIEKHKIVASAKSDVRVIIEKCLANSLLFQKETFIKALNIHSALRANDDND